MTVIDKAWGELIDRNTVRFERLLPGPITRVWDYLTDAKLRGTWFAGGPMEQRVGGKMDVVFDNSNLGAHPEPAPARFKKYEGPFDSKHVVTIWEPPHRLGFTWDDDMNPEGCVVEIALTEEGGKVRLVLTHRRLSGIDGAINVSGGWHIHLLM
ncbi:MAG: SRPBCC family protein, partial [Alphaproteobacteria bacterium]|nr:SRPBCC family protein [Alphaproteobacteria bacterium]MDX5415928.1 SRPBCC family protein [Alphaproteobacteria bacterium]MDX5493221.1 SRPBCC family protein [Alphaproteobacteria bacterium]